MKFSKDKLLNGNMNLEGRQNEKCHNVFIYEGEWHNLTFIFDLSEKSRKIYVDGNKVASDISVSAYLGAKGETKIGAWERPDKPEFYQSFNGIIDEVRVWLRPLKDEEILEGMNTKMAVEPVNKLVTTWANIKK